MASRSDATAGGAHVSVALLLPSLRRRGTPKPAGGTPQRDPSQHIVHGRVEGRRSGPGGAALDENAFRCRVLEARSQDPIHASGLAGPCRVRVNGLRADLAADRKCDDDEPKPPEGGRLPVPGAPASHTRRQVFRVWCVRHARFLPC